MKIAIFSDTFYPEINGVANVAYHSALRLLERGHDVLVVVPNTSEKMLRERAIPNLRIATYRSVPSFVYPGSRFALPFSLRTRRALRTFAPDIIHTHTPFSIGWTSVRAAKRHRAKLVGTHHTFFDHYLKHVKLGFGWAKRMSWHYVVRYYNNCDHVISPSKKMADGLSAYGLRSDSTILPNPIDTELFRQPDASQKATAKDRYGIKGKSVVYMGRLSYEKNVEYAIRAFALLASAIPDMTLMIIGDGPDRPKLERLARELSIETRTRFTGMLRGNDLVTALQANDVFITASESENMPLSVLEAMAVGLPVVAVMEKGIPEIVDDGTHGFLVQKGDIQGMANAVATILKDDELAITMGTASRKNAEKYSARTFAATLENIYRDMLCKKEI